MSGLFSCRSGSRGANPFRHWLYPASAALLPEQGQRWRNAEQQGRHKHPAPAGALHEAGSLLPKSCQRAAAGAVYRGLYLFAEAGATKEQALMCCCAGTMQAEARRRGAQRSMSALLSGDTRAELATKKIDTLRSHSYGLLFIT